MKSAGVFSTPRLVLREFSPGDAQGFFELNADPEVLHFTGDAPFITVCEAAIFIRNYDHYQRHGFGRWSVFLKRTGEYLGFCGLNYNASADEVDVGFRFMKRYWGNGFATEAAHGSIWYGFEYYHLSKIIARAMKENTASHRVIQKLGFKVVGKLNQEDGAVWIKYEIARADAVEPRWKRINTA